MCDHTPTPTTPIVPKHWHERAKIAPQKKLVLQAKLQSQSSSSDSSSSSSIEDEEEATRKRHVVNTFERYPLIPKTPMFPQPLVWPYAIEIP